MGLKEKNADVKKAHRYVGESSDWNFCVFLLSRGVYNLPSHTLQDYNGLILDETDSEYLPNWMEFDTIYLFRYKTLKKEVSNMMIPYTRILDIINATNIVFVDASKFTVMIEFGEYFDLVVFENIKEAWKFYDYVTTLYFNAKETQNSLCYKVGLNLKILFDEYRFNFMVNVFMILVSRHNVNYNRVLAEKLKIPIEEDQINFKAISEFYEIFLISFYSLAGYSSKFDKLKVFIDRFHELYFDFIKELLTNPYTEVD